MGRVYTSHSGLTAEFHPYPLLPFHPCSQASPFTISCVLVVRRTIPCDVVSSAEVTSTESHLTILCFNNCPRTRLLYGRLLGFYRDSAGRLSWYCSSRYAW